MKNSLELDMIANDPDSPMHPLDEDFVAEARSSSEASYGAFYHRLTALKIF